MRKEERIITVEDKNIGLLAYLVIDSTVSEGFSGGIRMLPNTTLQEIKDLARAMTLKQAFLGIPKGGARAGIAVKASLSLKEKQFLLNRFAEKISQLIIDKKYLPAPDMGTSPELILNMYKHIGARRSKTSPVSKDSGYFTALSVMEAIKVSLEALNLKLEESTFSIEGFGSVGSSLALALNSAGAKIVALSNISGALYNPKGLDIPKIINLKSTHKSNWPREYKDARQISKEELLELPVDVLSPCGRSYQINEENMERIKAKIVCAGANYPVTPAAAGYLFEKGILYLPDFVTNCGGVLGSTVQFMGLGEKSFNRILEKYVGKKLRKIIDISAKRQVSPLALATEITEESFLRIKRSKEKKTAKNKMFQLALGTYRKSPAPLFLVKAPAYNYFRKMLNQDMDIYDKYEKSINT